MISHLNSLGQSAALRSGILASKSDLVGTLDGDGQNDPSDLPKMIELINQEKIQWYWLEELELKDRII